MWLKGRLKVQVIADWAMQWKIPARRISRSSSAHEQRQPIDKRYQTGNIFGPFILDPRLTDRFVADCIFRLERVRAKGVRAAWMRDCQRDDFCWFQLVIALKGFWTAIRKLKSLAWRTFTSKFKFPDTFSRTQITVPNVINKAPKDIPAPACRSMIRV